MLRFPGGESVHVVVGGSQTRGLLTTLECEHAPGASGRHVHAGAHKAVCVLSGWYLFRVGPHQVQLGAGGFVFIPAGVAHDFAVAGDGGRALFSFTPAGIEQYFHDLAVTLASANGDGDVTVLRARYGIEPVSAHS